MQAVGGYWSRRAPKQVVLLRCVEAAGALLLLLAMALGFQQREAFLPLSALIGMRHALALARGGWWGSALWALLAFPAAGG